MTRSDVMDLIEEKIKCAKEYMELSGTAVNMKYFKGKIEAYTYVYNLLKEMKQ